MEQLAAAPQAVSEQPAWSFTHNELQKGKPADELSSSQKAETSTSY